MDLDKFAKVLAMAESDHAGEALSALRAARVMLARSGLNLRDLADSMRTNSHRMPESPPPEPEVSVEVVTVPVPSETHVRLVRELEFQVRDLQRQVERQRTDLDRHRTEARRWRRIAKETADKLWDMGKALERKEKLKDAEDRRRQVLDFLQDPTRSVLTDREISRRVGSSAVEVGFWRRRIAAEARRAYLAHVVRRGRRLKPMTDGRAFNRRPRRRR